MVNGDLTIIVGADSMIGSSLYRQLERSQCSVAGTSRRPSEAQYFLDLSSDPSQWPDLPHSKVIVICAALNSLELCEEHPELSFKVNVKAIENIIDKYKSKTSNFIFFSSSHVFDGRKTFINQVIKCHHRAFTGSTKPWPRKLSLENTDLL